MAFVLAVTGPAGPGHVPPAARITTFDIDGALGRDRPMPIEPASSPAGSLSWPAGWPRRATASPALAAAYEQNYA